MESEQTKRIEKLIDRERHIPTCDCCVCRDLELSRRLDTLEAAGKRRGAERLYTFDEMKASAGRYACTTHHSASFTSDGTRVCQDGTRGEPIAGHWTDGRNRFRRIGEAQPTPPADIGARRDAGTRTVDAFLKLGHEVRLDARQELADLINSALAEAQWRKA